MRTGGELGDVRLSDPHRTGILDAPHDLVVVVGDEIGVQRRPVGGAQARSAMGVLEGDRQTMQRSDRITCGQSPVRGNGRASGTLDVQADHRIHGRVHPVDLLEVLIEQFSCGELATA